jgi:hypothetical protein
VTGHPHFLARSHLGEIWSDFMLAATIKNQAMSDDDDSAGLDPVPHRGGGGRRPCIPNYNTKILGDEAREDGNGG